ncbi:MAG TPA: TlpA family protein disulfide reductase [Planctomycetaceae bacterium]|nr:TlpA family protein disulfide reductase [Planctomycetaceae bacterium]
MPTEVTQPGGSQIDIAAPPVPGGAAVPAAPSTENPGTPPGKITLPENFDPTTVPPPETNGPDNGAKEGGLKLPPLGDQSAAPVPADSARPASSYRFTSLLVQADEVSLKAADWEEIKSQATKTGKVTVVDVWSLACEPCLKEFPGLVAIDRDMGDSVACFAVDSDFDGRKTKPAESYRPRVEAFLKSVNAKFPNFLCTTPSDELFTELEIESIPAVLIFDSKGKLVRKFVDAGDDAGFTYHDNIVPFLKELLAKQ